jgi:hypothetical protein
MKIASTAAVDAVDAPNTIRNSRNHAIWYTSAHMPEPNKSGAILPAVMEEDAAGRGIEASELLQGVGFVKLEKGASSHVLGLVYRLGRGRSGGRGAHRRGGVVAPSPERTRSRRQRHSLGLVFS